MKRIFFVEDDPGLMKGLVFALEKQGYEVVCARTLHEAERCWDDGTFDLVILDVSLPDGTGFALCEEIRAQSKVPIIFLTAADEETDIIMGLDMGGDDYITKPFKLAVFLSRVNALLRRSTTYSETAQLLQSGGIAVDLLRRTVIVLTPEQILSRLWDHEARYIDSSTLTVYIRRLRTKIEDDASAPRHILTVRGMGYKWANPEGIG